MIPPMTRTVETAMQAAKARIIHSRCRAASPRRMARNPRTTARMRNAPTNAMIEASPKPATGITTPK